VCPSADLTRKNNEKFGGVAGFDVMRFFDFHGLPSMLPTSTQANQQGQIGLLRTEFSLHIGE
jgi:predicted cobalt transporter CbtA